MSKNAHAAPRLFVETPLALGAQVRLGAEQSRYLLRVMRLAAGDPVRVFNGADGEWRAEIAEAARDAAVLRPLQQTRAQAAPADLTLLFSPLKRQATDWLVEKATELGAGVLQPTLMRRTQAETVRLERLRLIAREAAEQTERLDVPEIRPPAQLSALLAGWPPDRPLIYADEAGDSPGALWGGEAGRAPPLAEALAGRPRPARFAALVGPEGGFDPAERALLRRCGFVVPVTLGPRILRAETATAALLTLLQCFWGDWKP